MKSFGYSHEEKVFIGQIGVRDSGRMWWEFWCGMRGLPEQKV